MILLPTVILAMPEGEDRDFMENLYRNHYRLMYSVAWKYIQESSLVEDVVSDSCLGLMGKIGTLRTLADKQLCVYIVTTVRNTSINAVNRRARMNRVFAAGDEEIAEAPDGGMDFTNKIVLEEELAAVMRAIRMLPEKEQQIMRMKFSQEMSDEAIAGEVGLSVNSIRKYVSRARNRIKAALYADQG